MDSANRAMPVPHDGGFPRALAAAACGLYAATVTVRLGGGWREALAGAALGLTAGGLHGAALARREVAFVRTVAVSFLATLPALAIAALLGPLDLERALVGGFTILAPIALLTLATGLLVRGGAEAGAGHLVRAAGRTLAIALGGAAAWTLGGRAAASLGNAALPPLAVTLPPPVLGSLLMLSGIALTVCLQARWRDAPWMIAGVLLAQGLQTLTCLPFLPEGCAFLSAFGLGALAILQSRVTGQAPALLIVPGLLQLATTFAGARVVAALADAGSGAGCWPGALMGALFAAAQLVGGLLFAEAAFSRPRAPRSG